MCARHSDNPCCSSSYSDLVSAATATATVTSSFRDACFVAVVFASRDELGRAVSLRDDSAGRRAVGGRGVVGGGWGVWRGSVT